MAGYGLLVWQNLCAPHTGFASRACPSRACVLQVTGRSENVYNTKRMNSMRCRRVADCTDYTRSPLVLKT